MLTNIENFTPQGKIFDTHAHYDDKIFAQDDNLFEQLKDFNVIGGISCGIDIPTIKKAIALVKDTDNWYAAVGFHPENLPQSLKEIDDIIPFLSDKKVVAVGEIGLDYYWNLSEREHQINCFARQLEIAYEYNLPAIVHDRDAHNDTLDILKKYKPKGVVHCFSGSAESAAEIVKLGMYIGIGGVVTFKNARKTVEVVKAVPLERILLETDAPYLTPEPYRGKPNHSGMIAFVAQKIAQIKGIDAKTVLEICNKNAYSLFKIK